MKEATQKDTFKIDNKKLLVGGGILLVAGIITGVIIYKKRKSKKLATQGYGGASGSGGSGFCKHGDSYPLKLHSCGKNVETLQKKLVALGIDIGDYGAKNNGVDGKYGKKTEAAVKKALGRSTFALADYGKLKATTVVV